jgi:preprotein translocase subunit SecY
MDPNIFFKATELKNKILFTLIALFVFRFGSYVTIPGINSLALSEFSQANSSGLLGIFNTLSGGSLSRMSIFALSIVPYITSSIVIQLLSMTFKPLSEMKKEGESGRMRINQYTRYLTIILATFQAYGIAAGLQHTGAKYGSIITIDLALFKVSAITSLVGGTIFLMWLGEQISARGIGNGTSLIIFTGIVSGLPQAFISVFDLVRTGAMSSLTLIMILLIVSGLIYSIVFVEKAQRKIPVQYPKRQFGNKVFSGETTHLPLKINTAGVIPPIFASSLLAFPATILNFLSFNGENSTLETMLVYLGRGKPLYLSLYVSFIVFFCFVYTAAIFNTTETSDMLKRNGGFIPGVRPGANTAGYLDHVLTRLTCLSAIYITFVCVLPEYGFSRYNIPFYLGGTSFLIVVNVVTETFSQIQSALFSHQYESLIKKARLRFH